MAKKTDGEAEPLDQLNAMIPYKLKRRMKLAAVNADKTITAVLIEWIEAGLAKMEKEQHGAKQERRDA